MRANARMADHPPEARERYFKRYTTVVSVSAGSGVGSPYISHECPADSLRFAAIHFLIASCAAPHVFTERFETPLRASHGDTIDALRAATEWPSEWRPEHRRRRV